jgi:hypothetical protein
MKSRMFVLNKSSFPVEINNRKNNNISLLSKINKEFHCSFCLNEYESKNPSGYIQFVDEFSCERIKIKNQL